MIKITQNAVNAFIQGQNFKSSNTEVKVLPNVTVMSLHGNEIDYKYNDPENIISITNAGWESNTTKERLNGIPGLSISQRKGVWYLNGNVWEGSLIDISKPVKP